MYELIHRGNTPELARRSVTQLSKSLKLRVGSTFARIDSLSRGLLRKRIMKQSGISPGQYNLSQLTGPLRYRTVPLALTSAGPDGKPAINSSLILDTREKTFPLDTTKPYKLNANTTGVCMSSICISVVLELTSSGRSHTLQS